MLHRTNRTDREIKTLAPRRHRDLQLKEHIADKLEKLLVGHGGREKRAALAPDEKYDWRRTEEEVENQAWHNMAKN